MNESQIKMKIMIIRSIDWVLFGTVLGLGIPALMYTDKQFMALVFILIGLGIVNLSGNWVVKKVASLRVELEKLERREKTGY
jgi:hypothetical protein